MNSGTTIEILPRAFFGGRLEGRIPVRFIYLDEAGTSAKEPVSVVAGIILHADTQYGAAEDALHAVMQTVPSQYRSGFHFHAKSVWGDPRYRDGWSLAERTSFLKNVMSIPRKLKIPVVMGMVRRDAPPIPGVTEFMKEEQFHHMMAFSGCIRRADKYIREHAPPSEIATIVAEDIPEMRSFLRDMLALDRIDGYAPIIDRAHLKMTKHEDTTGIFRQEQALGVKRIRDTVHFASKDDSPLLQLADACAFAFRRFLSHQTSGQEFAEAVTGKGLVIEDWSGAMSEACFPFHPRRFEPTAHFSSILRAKYT